MNSHLETPVESSSTIGQAIQLDFAITSEMPASLLTQVHRTGAKDQTPWKKPYLNLITLLNEEKSDGAEWASHIIPNHTLRFLCDLFSQTKLNGSSIDMKEIQGVFQCPITREALQDPVVAYDGYTYERTAITEWLAEHRRSPMTRQILYTKNLFVDPVLSDLLELLDVGSEAMEKYLIRVQPIEQIIEEYIAHYIPPTEKSLFELALKEEEIEQYRMLSIECDLMRNGAETNLSLSELTRAGSRLKAEKALRYASQALEYGPTTASYVQLQLWCVDILLSTSYYVKAVEKCQDLTKRWTWSDEILPRLALAYALAGDWPSAELMVKKLCEYKASPYTLALLAETKRRKGYFEEAEALWSVARQWRTIRSIRGIDDWITLASIRKNF